MKTFLFSYGLISLISWGVCHAQDKSKDVSNEDKSNDDKVYLIVEHQPEFPGGLPKLTEYIDSEVKKTKEKMKEGKGPKVMVFFEIDKTGKARNVRVKEVENDASGVWEKEAIRIISEMPAWKPGEQDGYPRNVQMAVPVNFNK